MRCAFFLGLTLFTQFSKYIYPQVKGIVDSVSEERISNIVKKARDLRLAQYDHVERLPRLNEALPKRIERRGGGDALDGRNRQSFSANAAQPGMGGERGKTPWIAQGGWCWRFGDCGCSEFEALRAARNRYAHRERVAFRFMIILQPLPEARDVNPDRGVAFGIEVGASSQNVDTDAVFADLFAVVTG